MDCPGAVEFEQPRRPVSWLALPEASTRRLQREPMKNRVLEQLASLPWDVDQIVVASAKDQAAWCWRAAALTSMEQTGCRGSSAPDYRWVEPCCHQPCPRICASRSPLRRRWTREGSQSCSYWEASLTPVSWRRQASAALWRGPDRSTAARRPVRNRRQRKVSG